ncbi:ExeA family protein [Marinimicrobium sp. ABcell2]|uniref:ExeA family protein n=1 Tax=Marinimicrobium sp. ABcell2 TaxID=3069751 RepID=UPI0027B61B3A|nr:ExeA family protein [Marinimicrobium sp. ABcell2]MDQ2075181.1 AAA family ATPase [Marinimicrobium sp. ABcell2]
MYHHFFGLEEQAFSIAVNPRYLFMSEQHREALAHLLYGIRSGGFVQLTGEVGTGKTTLVRCLLEQLPEQTDVAMILNPMASLPELLSSICDELRAPYPADQQTVKTLTDSLHSFLLHNHAQGRNTVLLIDEAQLLSTEALEQIRLLTNLETDTTKLLNIILVGQPELVDILAQPSLRQLSQRITARFHLRPLSLQETRAYIHHRLTVAGLESDRVLVPAAIAHKVYQFSGGVPRLINVICERMLLGAYARNTRRLNKAIFAQAEREVRGSRPANQDLLPQPPRRFPLAATVAGVAIALSATAAFVLVEDPRDALQRVTALLEAPQEPQMTAEALAAVGAFNLQTEPTPKPELNLTNSLLDAIPTEPDEPQAPLWTHDLPSAQAALAQHLGRPHSIGQGACDAAQSAGLQCEQRKLQTWDDLRTLDRPVVMTLITPERRRAYTTLTGLDEEHALLFTEGESRKIPWSELATLWTGDVQYLWYRPPGYGQSIAPGQSGDSVRWLAEQFAQLDNQSEPLTRSTYNARLKQRVEIFQRQQRLDDDGIVGAMTLQRLNQALGLEKPLSEPGSEQADHVARVEG